MSSQLSLRAKRSNPSLRAGIDGLLRRFAPRNDDGASRAIMVNRSVTLAPKPLAKHLFQNLPLDVLVGEGSIMPPPAIALHLLSRRDKAIRHLGEIGVGVVEAE